MDLDRVVFVRSLAGWDGYISGGVFRGCVNPGIAYRWRAMRLVTGWRAVDFDKEK